MQSGSWKHTTVSRSLKTTANVTNNSVLEEKPMEISRKTIAEIQASLDQHSKDTDDDKLVIAQVEKWMVAGASAVPQQKTLEQRGKFFSALKFSTLEQLLEHANQTAFV